MTRGSNAATFVNLFQPNVNASLLNLPHWLPAMAGGVEGGCGIDRFAVRAAYRARAHRVRHRQRAARRARRPLRHQFVYGRMAPGSAIFRPSRMSGASSPRVRSSPMSFMSPAFALAAAAVFGNDVGAVLVWSGTEPRELLGFFPARISERRYGLRLPVLIGWTHPYGPLGTPLVERDAAEPVIAAWLAHLAVNPALPGLLLLPLVAADGPFAAALDGILSRAQMPSDDFGTHSRALLEPGDDRADYLEHALSTHRLRELQPQRPAACRSRRAIVHHDVGAASVPRSRNFLRSKRAAGRARPVPRRQAATTCAAFSRRRWRRLPLKAKSRSIACCSMAAPSPRRSRCAAAAPLGTGRPRMMKHSRAMRRACC